VAEGTKSRIVDAALQTLKEEGFAGTSARAIARRGDFNQALIFYHFGTLTDLLLAALDKTSADRYERYSEAMRGITSIQTGIAVATDLYREDLAAGHLTVISEMIAGSLDRPDLGPQIVERMQPWIDLTTDAVEAMLGSIGATGIAPPRTVAHAIVALYLGIDLMSHLEHDDSKTEALFDAAKNLARLLSAIGIGGQKDDDGQHRDRPRKR
jgi:AcrR family transcriptional regulator